MWLLANTTTKLPLMLQKKHEQAVKLTDAEIWRKPLNYHFAAPKIKGLKYYSYIYTSPSAAAMQNRHFLGHNQSPSNQKQPAWLLIVTSRRKVLVLELTKSILKICIWQQVGVLGRATRSEQEWGIHVITTQKWLIFQSEDTGVELGCLADRTGGDQIRTGPGSSCCYHKHRWKIITKNTLVSSNVPLPCTRTCIKMGKRQKKKKLSAYTKISIHKWKLQHIHTFSCFQLTARPINGSIQELSRQGKL